MSWNMRCILKVMRLLLPFLLVSVLGSSYAPPLKPVRWSLADGAATRTVASGRVVEVTLQAEIEKGWYIYSLTQKPGGPIPLRIQLVGAADVGVRGAIKAPKPVTKFDPNFGIETELHRGKPKFTLAVGVPAGSLAGKRDLQIAARYQACSETLCLPPRTEKIGLTLRITSAR
jgi:thiol:disulfide interchange protein